MRDPQRPKTKKELLEPWAQHQTRQYEAVCAELAELEKLLSELEPERTKILEEIPNLGANIDELGRWLTLPIEKSKIAGEVKPWLQRPSSRPKEPMPDLAEKFPDEFEDIASVNTLIAIKRITRRMAQLEKETKRLERRLRRSGFPIPTEDRGAETRKNPSHGKKPGPKGPRKQSVVRRFAIKLLKSEGLKGEIACRKLEGLGVPLASKTLQEIYGECGWVSWFKHDRKGFYGQWSADLARG